MKFFNNLNITQRLNILQILLIISSVIVGITFLTVNKLQSNLNKETARLNTEVNLSEQANSSLLMLRRHEKDFLARLDDKYNIKHEKEMNKLNNIFQQLLSMSNNSQNKRVISSAQQFAKQYRQAYIELVEIQKAIGLSEKSGLHGKMRNSIHLVEEKLKSVNNLLLDRSMLTMRRHEKDFIQRRDTQYTQRLINEFNNFNTLLNQSDITFALKEEIANLTKDYYNSFLAFAADIDKLIIKIADMRAAAHSTEPLFSEMAQVATTLRAEKIAAAASTNRWYLIIFFTVLTLMSGVIIFSLMQISKGIRLSLSSLGDTVKRIADGDYSARTNLKTGDEIGDFSTIFDQLLDDRVATLAATEKENDKLNDSIIDLMEAVFKLSEKNLSIRIKVAEDVTGPVADSINLMVEETVTVLSNIKSIAESVEVTVSSVREQGDILSQVASQEREVVTDTMSKLELSSNTMSNIAKVASKCNVIAARASKSTGDALKIVTNTERGMGDIRETIAETEKRIKRLAERSQEITSIVEIINNISERTHVLALNASMQAAAAGDAGRGFAVVADEVQRLAESSRQSTSEIGSLVKNIQSETAEAMLTMNTTISQVVEGTKLAQHSARQMMSTQKTAEELTVAVAQIAKFSTSQAKANSDLVTEASQIVQSTEKTSIELDNQLKQTNELVMYSKKLLDSVLVFKLQA